MAAIHSITAAISYNDDDDEESFFFRWWLKAMSTYRVGLVDWMVEFFRNNQTRWWFEPVCLIIDIHDDDDDHHHYFGFHVLSCVLSFISQEEEKGKKTKEDILEYNKSLLHNTSMNEMNENHHQTLFIWCLELVVCVRCCLVGW